MKIAVIGKGKWGGAIGNLLLENNYSPTFFSRDEFDKLKIMSFDVAFIALKTSAIEGFLQTYAKFLPNYVCLLSKGFLSMGDIFFSDFFEKTGKSYAILSGPNFADEVDNKDSTVTTIATTDAKFFDALKRLLTTSYFEIEFSDDVKCIEIFAIFKNIIAIHVGYMQQQNYPFNTKSKFVTKLIKEMMDFVKIFSTSPESFFLSAGIGDIFLTCTSYKSRNFEYGFNFDILTSNDFLANSETIEGVRSLLIIPQLEKVYNFNFTYYKKLYNFFINRINEDI